VLSQTNADVQKVWLQVFRDGAASQVGGWMSELQSESSISPLWEVMFQLMCHPVPQVRILCYVPPHRGSLHPYFQNFKSLHVWDVIQALQHAAS